MKVITRLANFFKKLFKFDLALNYFDYSLEELEKALFARHLSHEVLFGDKL